MPYRKRQVPLSKAKTILDINKYINFIYSNEKLQGHKTAHDLEEYFQDNFQKIQHRFLRRLHILLQFLIETKIYVYNSEVPWGKPKNFDYVHLFLIALANYEGMTSDQQIRDRRSYFMHFNTIFKTTNIIDYPFWEEVKLNPAKRQYFHENPLPNNEFALCLYMYSRAYSEPQRREILKYFFVTDVIKQSRKATYYQQLQLQCLPYSRSQKIKGAQEEEEQEEQLEEEEEEDELRRKRKDDKGKRPKTPQLSIEERPESLIFQYLPPRTQQQQQQQGKRKRQEGETSTTRKTRSTRSTRYQRKRGKSIVQPPTIYQQYRRAKKRRLNKEDEDEEEEEQFEQEQEQEQNENENDESENEN